MHTEENNYWYLDTAEALLGGEYEFLLTIKQGRLHRIDPYAHEVITRSAAPSSPAGARMVVAASFSATIISAMSRHLCRLEIGKQRRLVLPRQRRMPDPAT
jgi:hypothetical protein